MTTFDDKEKAAENKYARDKETEFKIHARADKLLGLWVAGKLGISGDAAEAYARTIVELDMQKTAPQQVFEKIRHDLLAKDVHVSDHDIRAEMHRLEGLARQQITQG